MKQKKPEKPGGGDDGSSGGNEDLSQHRKKADDIFADIGDMINSSISEDPTEFLNRARQSGGQ